MKRIKWAALYLSVGLLLASCAPMITVSNNTGFPVRAIVSSGGTSNVVSPSPGESSSVEAVEGPYRVTVIPDAEWIEYAKLTRQYLNDQLAHSENLTGPQLLEVIQRLKDIAQRMSQFEQAAGGAASCAGSISEDGGGSVSVSSGVDGAMVIVCQ